MCVRVRVSCGNYVWTLLDQMLELASVAYDRALVFMPGSGNSFTSARFLC